MHQFEKLEEEIELQPILESLAARPPLDVTLDKEMQARLPLIFGGISVALAKTFKFIDAELKAVHTKMGTDVQPLPAADLNRHGRVPGPSSLGAARSRRVASPL